MQRTKWCCIWGACLQADQFHFQGASWQPWRCSQRAEPIPLPCRWVFLAPLTAGLLTEAVALTLDSNSMLQAGAPFWANLPEDLLVSVFSAFDHPRDLLACACVCKAWRSGKAKAVLPVLDVWWADLRLLIQLNHVQMAAVKDVHIRFTSVGPGYATASVMLFTFICGRIPMLQRLKL